MRLPPPHQREAELGTGREREARSDPANF